MLHALRAGADVVLGSRALGNMLEGGMPYYKYVGNRVLTWIENLAFGTRISSFHCGFKACNRKSVAEIPYRQLTDGYHFDGQFMVVASKRGLRLEQLPVTTIYYADGVSNLRGGPYLLEIFAFIFQYHWSRAWRLLRAEGRPAPF